MICLQEVVSELVFVDKFFINKKLPASPLKRAGTINGQVIKTVKQELFFYMDYMVLAHWIMGDGSKRAKGLILCTDNFSLLEVVLLVNILILKFDINPTIQREKNKFRIYINGKSLMKIKPFILPYFVDHFLYKIN